MFAETNHLADLNPLLRTSPSKSKWTIGSQIWLAWFNCRIRNLILGIVVDLKKSQNLGLCGDRTFNRNLKSCPEELNSKRII